MYFWLNIKMKRIDKVSNTLSEEHIWVIKASVHSALTKSV